MQAWQIQRVRRRTFVRWPLIGGWIRRRAARRLAAAAAEGAPAAVPALVAAARRQDDPDVARIAAEGLHGITHQRCVDALVDEWAEHRDPRLRQLIIDRRWLATDIDRRVLSALLTDRSKVIIQGNADVVAPLVAACDDADPAIARAALDHVERLTQPGSIDALCEEIARVDRPEVARRAVEAGFLPSDPPRQALFLFMTGQWDRYHDLDFDQRLLRTVYESTDPETRLRITGQMQASGRVDLLPLITGGDHLTRVDRMTPTEAEFLVEMMSQHEQWDRLWRLVFEFPVVQSARALLALAGSDWRPDGADDRRILDELRAYAGETAALDPGIVSEILPPALQCERLSMPGRINTVAFSPRRPVLAIGTGSGKAVVWDFHRAVRERRLDGFDHAIGCVNYTGDDLLVCGERTASVDDPVAVRALVEDRLVDLKPHAGFVTALEPLDGTQLISAGRDRVVRVWDVAAGRCLLEKELPFWPRSLRASPEGGHVAMLHKRVTSMRLPELDRERHSYRDPHPGVSKCCDFAPDGQSVIAGKHNGHVVVFRPKQRSLLADESSLILHDSPVRSVQVLRSRKIIVTGASRGRVTFHNWSNGARVGELEVVGERLTSLTVSPDGAYMAIGDSDSSMTLWDLRLLDVPLLFSRPMARAVPAHLAVVAELAEHAGIDARMRPCLNYLESVLKHRFRYDIEIDDVPTIKVGEFDIEID